MDKIPNFQIKGDSLSIGDSQAPFVRATFRGALVAATSNTAGAVLTLTNDTGYDMYVNFAMIDVTTKSTGVATLAMGTAATVVSSNNLLDAADVSTAAIIASNVVGGGTAGKISRWVNGRYLTVTASASVAGLVGRYFIEGTPV